jgi:ATPase subunit of ABC transporter with duplicated ATPase domains
MICLVWKNYSDPDKGWINGSSSGVASKIDALGAWEMRIKVAMDALRTPDEILQLSLSGGRRHVALCRLLLQQPDVLR